MGGCGGGFVEVRVATQREDNNRKRHGFPFGLSRSFVSKANRTAEGSYWSDGGNKCRNITLQVEEVLKTESIQYAHESCETQN
jgi:hypothetical protein